MPRGKRTGKHASGRHGDLCAMADNRLTTTTAAVAATSSRPRQKRARHGKAARRESSMSAVEIDTSSLAGRVGARDDDAESDITRETATTAEDARLVHV